MVWYPRFITRYRELEIDETRSPAELFEATAASLAQEGFVLTKISERRQRRNMVSSDRQTVVQIPFRKYRVCCRSLEIC